VSDTPHPFQARLEAVTRMVAEAPQEAGKTAPMALAILGAKCPRCGQLIEIPEDLSTEGAMALLMAEDEKHSACPIALGVDPPEVDPTTERDPGAPEEPAGP